MGFNIMDLKRAASRSMHGTGADEQAGRAVMKYIDVYDLEPSEENFYPMSAIDELATLLEIAGGVKQPGLVVPLGGGKYKLLAGHRRRLASIRLVEQGKEAYRKMPCMVEEMRQEEAEELRKIDEKILLIATNGQREKTDWVKVQEATELRELLDRKRRFEKVTGQTRQIIAEQLGTTPAQVGRYESIAKHLLEDFKLEMQAERVNISVGYELSTLSEQDQEAALEEFRRKGALSLEDVRRRKQKEPPALRSAEVPKKKSAVLVVDAPGADAHREEKKAEEALLPCPFCGGKASLNVREKDGGFEAVIMCSSTADTGCFARMKHWAGKKEWAERSAARAWNRRKCAERRS